MRKSILACILLFLAGNIFSQNDTFEIDYSYPQKFIIKGIKVQGNEDIDHNLIISFSGLNIGSEIFIPGDKISQAVRNLWKQRLFSNVSVVAEHIEGEDIYLIIEVQTRPRMSKYSVTGVSKSDADKLKEKISLSRNEIVTQQLLFIVRNQIADYFIEKGFLYPEIEIKEEKDTSMGDNYVALSIHINRNKKIRINEIIIEGNNQEREEKSSAFATKFDRKMRGEQLVSDRKIRSLMKKTKQHSKINVFRSSKFISKLYEEDKDRVIAYYNTLGFRDASIVFDTVKLVDNEYLRINIKFYEGNRYYFRNISWTGNSKYSNEQLDAVLGIKKGEIYNPATLEQRLHGSMTSLDVSALYMDNGYLFFHVEPVEKVVENDSIDIEIRIFEGPPAIISEVTISGNLRTSDHVILREIRTRPGQLFSREDIIRTQRELVQLGYFDDQQIGVIPKPDPQNGTVAIEYKLVEKASDQFQLQGGWGAGQFVGSAGFMFSNFSSRKMFKPKAWRPLPAGDGQRLSFRFQSNAIYYSSFNISFTEPWFGGKKPNSLTISLYRSLQSNGLKTGNPDRQEIRIAGATVGMGKRLSFPDDWFTLYNSITFQRYDLQNYQYEFSFTDGFSNNLNVQHIISRNSIDNPIYTRTGSVFSLALQWTPPYSLFSDKDYGSMSIQDKFKWNEYHKWKFEANWFINVIDKLVFNPRVQYGFLGSYNKKLGITPFERFYVGGDGLTGYHLDGRDLIALRGYENNSLTAESSLEKGATIYSKYTFEIRYPLSLNPSATIYGLVFAEAGNSWLKFNEFNPFNVYRSLGAGVRIYMMMFGLLGFDWGYGFDEVPNKPGANKGQFHISIGQQF